MDYLSELKYIGISLKHLSMEFKMKKIYMLLVLLGTLVSITACSNTFDGVKQDVGNAADEVKDATN